MIRNEERERVEKERKKKKEKRKRRIVYVCVFRLCVSFV
jgi:hypothetical protein